jgi:hypothetical protein
VARVRTWHEFSMPAVRALMTSPVGGVARDMYRRGQNVRSRALVLAGADTGRLRTSIHVELVHGWGVVGVRVGSAVAYAVFHHEGHGPIVPRQPGGVLVFRPQGGGPLVFTRHVRPVEGTEFLRKALPAARD